jgi:hypothetical protein
MRSARTRLPTTSAIVEAYTAVDHHGVLSRRCDIERPHEPLALVLLASRIKLALTEEQEAALLAPPLIDLIDPCGPRNRDGLGPPIQRD